MIKAEEEEEWGKGRKNFFVGGKNILENNSPKKKYLFFDLKLSFIHFDK